MVIICHSHQHTTHRIKPILLLQDLQGCPIADALVRAGLIIRHFPEAVLIPALFRTAKPEDMKTFFVIGTMTAFDEPILPGRPGLNRAMLNPERLRHALKGCSPFGMSAIAHREGHRIIGHDEKKGGKRSHAR